MTGSTYAVETDIVLVSLRVMWGEVMTLIFLYVQRACAQFILHHGSSILFHYLIITNCGSLQSMWLHEHDWNWRLISSFRIVNGHCTVHKSQLSSSSTLALLNQFRSEMQGCWHSSALLFIWKSRGCFLFLTLLCAKFLPMYRKGTSFHFFSSLEM